MTGRIQRLESKRSWSRFAWGHRYLVIILIGLGLIWPYRALGKLPKSHIVPARPRPAPELCIDYQTHIQPILEARCYRCHGERRQEAGLRLDTPTAIRQGADGGKILVPGDRAKSHLALVLSGEGDTPLMPPSRKLDAREYTKILTWIDRGAEMPPDIESVRPTPVEHWAFRTPVRPTIPVGSGSPIDALLAAQRAKHGVTQSPTAAPAVLLRRVSIDLTGLPPTREELAAYLADAAPGAYSRAVDRLLASPHYGERWGRHWMDIWRYSDPDGRKAKNDIRWGNAHIWRWRDWIVDAVNADVGYDRMVTDMLAGDEARPNDPAALAATGFLVRNYFKLDRDIWINNTVEHTAKAFLGLSLHCARCHDHKFDPITQKEYYQFRAVFEPHDIRTHQLPDEDPEAMVARAYDLNPDAPTFIYLRGDAKNPLKNARIAPGVPAALGGEFHATPVTTVSPASTGRRLALARWLVNGKQPLTARVAVNHVWARHFGRPLVENVTDFGLRTPAPIHQELLDWLAVEFMEHGWSLKWLHREILMSEAYQMTSSMKHSSQATLTADPDNQFYWRMNPRRMEAEVVRDSLLHLAGVLDPVRGGVPLDQATGTTSARRSIYYRYSREDKMEFLTAFDAPGVEECYRRQESVVPQQALALENSPFVLDQARRMTRLLGVESQPREFIAAAFEHVLGRPADEPEIEICLRFLSRQEALHADRGGLTEYPLPPPPPPPPDAEFLKRVPGLPIVYGTADPLPEVEAATDAKGRAREDFIHALINHNDFITVR